jgi:hypothetical protein
MSYYNGGGEELMWLRLQDFQREAETRRLLRQGRRRPGRTVTGGRVRRWLAGLGS